MTKDLAPSSSAQAVSAGVDKPYYIATTREKALAAPRYFVGISGHKFLCETPEEADQMFARLSVTSVSGRPPRWYVWSADLPEQCEGPCIHCGAGDDEPCEEGCPCDR